LSAQPSGELTLREQVVLSQSTAYQYDIFLSFSSRNIADVRPVCDQLRGYGLRVFFSDDTLRNKASVSFLKLISNALQNSRWKAIMGKNPSNFKNCDDCPVESVSWNDIQEFLKKLNAQTGKNYRLPTEAEWEYACRAGSTTPFNTGNCLSTSQANYHGNYPYQTCEKGKYKAKTTPVESYQPNAWGLYDMHGNVWEWCQDRYDTNYYQSSPSNNSKGASAGSDRVLRGGSWGSYAQGCRKMVAAVCPFSERWHFVRWGKRANCRLPYVSGFY